MSEPVVQVTDLVKRYGEIEAVRGINFAVTAGETFGFLGPNGAGKSTTIKILCTLANPSSGSARVAGYDVVKKRDDVRRNIGWSSRTPPWTATSPASRTSASTPTSTASPGSSSRPGSSRSWRW